VLRTVRLIVFEPLPNTIEFVQQLLEPELVDLMDDYEEQFVMLRPVRAGLLQRKKFIDFQVVRVRNGRVGHDPSCERSKLSLKISDRRVSAYKIDGTRLWRIDLGRNIRAGAHYTQFIVYDLDGDGRAEVACKTADGTVDGLGTVIGDATKDYRSLTVPIDGIQVLATNDARYGKILAGPEYLDWNTSSLVRLLTATGAAANNGTKANAALTADLFGDWREEVIWRAADNTSLRIYSTTIPGRIESTRSCTIRSTVWRSRGRTLVTISRHIRVSISARV